MFDHVYDFTLTIFWIMQILCFDQKIKNNLKNFYNRNTSSSRIESTAFILPNGWWHRCATGVLSDWQILLFIEATDYRSNFEKTILFENCSCFSKIPFSISVESPRIFQCLISISAGSLQVSEFGKSTAIYLSDFLCQLYSALWSAWQEDLNDPQECCAMARTSCARL